MINLIMPYYNNKSTIKRALASIAAQTKEHKLLVTIVDDGSDEGQTPEEEIELFSNLFPIQYYKIEHTGAPGLVRQYAIDRTHCDYIMFLDSDDVLLPRAAEVLSKEALLNSPDLIIGYFYRENEKEQLELMNEKAFTWLHGNLYKTSFIKENEIIFFEWLNEDGGFNVQVAELTKNTRVIPEPLMIWMNNPNSITRKNKDFVVKLAADYINTYTRAYERVIDKKLSDKKYEAELGRRLGQFYCFCNEEMRKTGSLSKKTSDAFERFLKDCINWQIISKPEFLNHACYFINQNTIFPDMCAIITLPDFLKRYNLSIDLTIGEAK